METIGLFTILFFVIWLYFPLRALFPNLLLPIFIAIVLFFLVIIFFGSAVLIP